MKKGTAFLLLGIGGLLLYKSGGPQAVLETIEGKVGDMTRDMRFNMYRRAVEEACKENDIPAAYVPWVFGLVEQESDWNPRAYRFEPHINDASYGLMQILLKTARGVGFTGTPEELYDPTINARYGVKFLASQLRRYQGDWESAIEAYNRGRALPDAISVYAQSVFAKSNKYPLPDPIW